MQADAQSVSVGLDENEWEEVFRIKNDIGREKRDSLSYSRQVEKPQIDVQARLLSISVDHDRKMLALDMAKKSTRQNEDFGNLRPVDNLIDVGDDLNNHDGNHTRNNALMNGQPNIELAFQRINVPAAANNF